MEEVRCNGEEEGFKYPSSNLPVGHSSRVAGTTTGIGGSTAEGLSTLMERPLTISKSSVDPRWRYNRHTTGPLPLNRRVGESWVTVRWQGLQRYRAGTASGTTAANLAVAVQPAELAVLPLDRKS